MKIIDDKFNEIIEAPKKDKKEKFVDFCKTNIDLVEDKKISISQASYNICGACGECFEDIMPEYSELMDITCDLELPSEHRDRPLDDWEKVKEIFK